MPSWKKLIQSGSTAHLSEVSASGNIVAEGSVTASRITASMDIRNLDEISSNLTPVKNQVLMFNGTEFVSADPDSTFTFSITSFSDGIGTHTQLIGDGVWKNANTISFTCGYENGPPNSAKIEEISGLDVEVSNFTTPFASDLNTIAINYPDVNNSRQFRLTADGGDGNQTRTDTAIYFFNQIWYGKSTTTTPSNSSITSSLSDVFETEDSGNSSFTRKNRNSLYIASPQNNYIYFIYPSRLGNIANHSGTSNPKFELGTSTSNNNNGKVSAGFQSLSSITIQNTAGFSELYKVYRSINTIDANTALYMDTNGNASLMNYVYFGELNKESSGDGTSTYTADDVVDNSNITPGLRSNLTSQTNLSVNSANNTEFVYFAYPSRLGELPPMASTRGLIIGGQDSLSDFHFDANVDNELSITNIYGYTEDYYVYVSKNPGFDNVTISIQP